MMLPKPRLLAALVIALLVSMVLVPAAGAAPATASVATQQSLVTESVTFNIYYNGQQIATTVTSETFFGPLSVGTWITTDMTGTTISYGKLVALHYSTGLTAVITQQSPIQGYGTLSFSYGMPGSGQLMYVAFAPGGTQSGVVHFTAMSPTTNVWNVDVDAVPPVLFTGPTG